MSIKFSTFLPIFKEFSNSQHWVLTLRRLRYRSNTKVGLIVIKDFHSRQTATFGISRLFQLNEKTTSMTVNYICTYIVRSRRKSHATVAGGVKYSTKAASQKRCKTNENQNHANCTGLCIPRNGVHELKRIFCLRGRKQMNKNE